MYGGKGWGKVGVWESLEIEIRGWGAGEGNRKERYRPNFASGVAVVAGVDGDGEYEAVINTVHSGFMVYDLSGSVAK